MEDINKAIKSNLYKENSIDEKIMHTYLYSFENELCDNSEIYNLILIGTKILSCNKSNLKVDVDIDRLFDEFRYFQYYQKKTNIYILNFFLPIILATRNFESCRNIILDLTEKVCKFYKISNQRIKYIIDLYCYDKVIRSKFKGKIDYKNVLLEIKDGLIDFHVDFDDKKENLMFHIEKIKYIEEIHRYIDNEEHSCDIVFLEILRNAFLQKGDTDFEIVLKEDVGIYSVYNALIENDGNLQNTFLKSMANFLLKVRYFNIDIKKYHRQSHIKNFSIMNVGDEFLDPILNRAKIIDIKIDNINKIKYVTIETKTGTYIFKYNIEI